MIFSLPVLMYHSISRFKSGLCVSPECFEEHCKALAEAGWRGISLAEAEEYFLKKRRLPGKTCLFTFDDGYLDNYVYAEPILRRYGHYGAVFPVAECLEKKELLRPTQDTLAAEPGRTGELPNLDKRSPVSRSCLPVHNIDFCSWREVRHMHQSGNMAAAPHSLRHDRVVKSLVFTHLYRPGGRDGYFSGPPYKALWGLPRFTLGHSLACPGYTLAPELFDLVKGMVPQEGKAAQQFLGSEKNRKAVIAAVGKLPCLGGRETEAEYRARIFQEFVRCREVFTAQLGSAPVSFCWPWGSYNAIALEEAQKAGFRMFFTTSRGANRPGGAQHIHRIAMRGWTKDVLLQKMSLAANAVLEEPYGWWMRLHRTEISRRLRRYIRSRL